MFKCVKLFTFLLLGLSLGLTPLQAHATEPEADWFNYHWGRGLTVPAANLNIGGYLKSSYSRQENQPEAAALDNFSLFITWTPHSRLRFFSEIQQYNWLNNVDVAKPFVESLSVERLFVEVLLNESWSVRFGKFLTPFGRWNVIHSAPLVWTTNRPIVTNDFSFAPRANGLMVNYTTIINEHNLDVSVYLDDSTDLEPKSINNVIFDKAAGLRVNYELSEQFQIGLSYLAFQQLKDLGLPTHHLFGVDFMWQYQGYELLMESLYHVRDDANGHFEEKGLFLQGVAPLYGKLYAVGRYEYFDTKIYEQYNPNDVSHVGLVGLAWRPYLPLVFKSEYRFGNNNAFIAPSGFYLSVAMFF